MNRILMETLVNDGNGRYVYFDDLEEAQKLFVGDLTSTLLVVALDAKVQVYFHHTVQSLRVDSSSIAARL